MDETQPTAVPDPRRGRSGAPVVRRPGDPGRPPSAAPRPDRPRGPQGARGDGRGPSGPNRRPPAGPPAQAPWEATDPYGDPAPPGPGTYTHDPRYADGGYGADGYPGPRAERAAAEWYAGQQQAGPADPQGYGYAPVDDRYGHGQAYDGGWPQDAPGDRYGYGEAYGREWSGPAPADGYGYGPAPDGGWAPHAPVDDRHGYGQAYDGGWSQHAPVDDRYAYNGGYAQGWPGDDPYAPDLTEQSAESATATPRWVDEPSLLGPRVVAIVAVLLVVTGVVCAQVLPWAATPPASLMKDSFARTADGLGSTDTGQAWQTPTPGRWATADGAAYVVDPNPDRAGRTMALIDLGSDNGSVTATIADSSQGWGLVFRYRGPQELWLLTASPKFASYNITHIRKGRAEAVDKVAMARQNAGTRVTVQFQGPQVTVLIDGRPTKTITDPDGGNGGHLVGMVLADGSSTQARWKEFEARRLPLSPDSRLTTTTNRRNETTRGR